MAKKVADQAEAEAALVERNADRDNEIAPDTTAYAVIKPFDVHELSVKLGVAIGSDPVELTVEGDPRLASADNPVTVWVAQPGIDSGAISGALSTLEPPSVQSVPSPGEDMPPPSPVLSSQELDALAADRALLADLAGRPADQSYNDDEVQRILRTLLKPYKET